MQRAGVGLANHQVMPVLRLPAATPPPVLPERIECQPLLAGRITGEHDLAAKRRRKLTGQLFRSCGMAADQGNDLFATGIHHHHGRVGLLVIQRGGNQSDHGAESPNHNEATPTPPLFGKQFGSGRDQQVIRWLNHRCCCTGSQADPLRLPALVKLPQQWPGAHRQADGEGRDTGLLETWVDNVQGEWPRMISAGCHVRSTAPGLIFPGCWQGQSTQGL